VCAKRDQAGWRASDHRDRPRPRDAERWSRWKDVLITRQRAWREMEISSAVEAADMEIFSIIAQIRISYVGNFGLMAHGRRGPEEGFRGVRGMPHRRQGGRGHVCSGHGQLLCIRETASLGHILSGVDYSRTGRNMPSAVSYFHNDHYQIPVLSKLHYTCAHRASCRRQDRRKRTS
jgi:hypothetical protein